MASKLMDLPFFLVMSCLLLGEMNANSRISNLGGKLMDEKGKVKKREEKEAMLQPD
jgi:hypothetical protein